MQFTVVTKLLKDAAWSFKNKHLMYLYIFAESAFGSMRILSRDGDKQKNSSISL